MKYSEIGSEFWSNPLSENTAEKKIAFSESFRGFLCGRTALDHIIRDAQREREWKSVLLPSYCCDTMIIPFLQHGISVRFYSIVPAEHGLRCILPAPRQYEAIYIMQYFGFIQNKLYLPEEIKQWDFCILDRTHSCFCKEDLSFSDWNIKYVYASYRKWTDIRGFACAIKTEGDFTVDKPAIRNDAYFRCRQEACTKKRKYIEEGKGDKQEFLQLYEQAEAILEDNYINYAAGTEGIAVFEALAVEKIIRKRKENADYLIKHLRENKRLHLLFAKQTKGDCPLALPVLVKDGRRDMLRKYLIDKNIYCPVHWPLTSVHGKRNIQEDVLYNSELSLVCDQRYGIEEMQRIVNQINAFFSKG